MNFKRVKYKMSKDDNWKVGYMIGKYDGDNRTLLDENLNVVDKIEYNGKKFTIYDVYEDIDKRINITIEI